MENHTEEKCETLQIKSSLFSVYKRYFPTVFTEGSAQLFKTDFTKLFFRAFTGTMCAAEKTFDIHPLICSIGVGDFSSLRVGGPSG